MSIAPTAAPSGRRSDRDAQVPEDLFASWCPTLSPECDRVAFISDRGGVPEIWIRSLTAEAAVVMPLAGRRVVAVTWSPTGEWLGCVVAPPGASRTEVWVVRPDGSDARLVAGAAPRTADLPRGRSRGWTERGDLVVTEDGEGSRVLRVDPANGEVVVLATGDLVHGIDVSADGRRLLLRRGPRGARQLVVAEVDQPERAHLVLAPPTAGSTDLGCLSANATLVHVRTDADRDCAELVTVSIGAENGLEVDEGRSVVGRFDGELEDVVLSADSTIAALTWNVDGGLSALSLLEVPTGRQRAVVPLPRPVVHGCELSADGSRLVFTAEGPADPRGVWSLDVATALSGASGSPSGLVPLSSPGRGALRASRGATAADIDPARIVVPDLISLRSGDGTTITGWLYSPGGVGPFPTLIWLHGGPEAQERPVYNSLFQSVVAAGIAVFAPNVRGSTGHGRAFRHADDGPGRYGAFEDVAACAEHLVEIGVGEPGRLGVSGRSYGGYLTLCALVRYPHLFAVGVDVSGMSDLHTFYENTEPWIAAAAVTKYGHPDRDAEMLRDLSPIHLADRMNAPLLIVHGADDTNVPLGEAEQMAAALTELGLPHELLVFEGEGHELLATQTRVQFVHTVVNWVVAHLCGETEQLTKT